MKITLVTTLNLSSWHEQDTDKSQQSVPLGVLSLAAVAERDGHAVSIFDSTYETEKNGLALNDDFYSQAATRILRSAPELVGFSTMGNSFHTALRIAEAVKRLAPGAIIVMGGPHVSVVDEATLSTFSFVDYIVRGEAEISFPLFVNELAARAKSISTKGVTWRKNGVPVRNPDQELLPDLDALPLPAYHLLPYSPGFSGEIDAGRGCPFSCTFCSTATFWRRNYRLKSIDRTILEMKNLRENYGASTFSFQHDLFTLNKGRIERFCERLHAEGFKEKWSCSARFDCVSEELLETMARAGCSGLFYGVETGSARMQKVIKKNLDLTRVFPLVKKTVELGMAPTISLIAGFPEETEEDVAADCDLIARLITLPKVSVQLHLLGPENGTADYARYRERLRFDGCYSDIAGTSYRFLEPELFRSHPDLFSCFHYYEPLHVSRSLLQGLDLFVHGPCAIMRRTILGLIGEQRGLWRLYRDWRAWADREGKGAGPHTGQKIEEYLLDFSEFVEFDGATREKPFDSGIARDEVLEFFLRHYGEMPVRTVKEGDPIPGDESGQTDGPCMAAQQEGCAS
jgi:radical SAM superfamily enzyme YgiQ (UPF0313 family)